MKILIVSDTHGHSEPFINLLDSLSGLDGCIFLGDGDRDADEVALLYPKLPLYRVRGNCDLASMDPDYGLAPFGGVLVYYTHGHLLGVKRSLDTLWQTAQSCGAQVALFGHTHVPFHEVREGIHLFNPGSLALPRAHQPSYGILTVTDQKPKLAIRWYTGGKG